MSTRALVQQLIVSELADHEQVEDLAATIRDAQLREIRQMSNWLNSWGRS